MLFEIENKSIFNKKLNEYLIKNEKEYGILEDYYEGEQWASPGIITRAGVPAIDKRRKDKNYMGIVDNISKDCVDTLTALSVGVEGLSITESSYLSVDWKMLVSDMFKNGYIYDDVYLKLGKNDLNKLTLTTIEAEDILWFEDEEGKVVEADIIMTIGYRNGQDIYKVISYVNGMSRVFEDGQLVSEEQNLFIPVYKIKFGVKLMETLIALQDVINIMHTQEFEINKYQGDPLTVIKGMQMVDMHGKEIDKNSIKLGSGEILLIGEGGEVTKLDAKGVDEQFANKLKEFEKKMYKQAKIGPLKNEDLSGVISGYAIQLKLLETFNFVNQIRDKVKSGLQPIFDIIKVATGVEMELEFSDMINISKRDKIEEAKMLLELGYTQEEIKTYIGL